VRYILKWLVLDEKDNRANGRPLYAITGHVLDYAAGIIGNALNQYNTQLNSAHLKRSSHSNFTSEAV